MIENFIFDIAASKGLVRSVCRQHSKRLKEEIGEESVVLGLSGGWDSLVAALLLHRAIGDNYIVFLSIMAIRKND